MADEIHVPATPFLPGFYRVIPMGHDAIQVRSAGRVLRVTGPGVGDFGPRLLGLLDGRSSLASVVAQLALDAGPATDLVGQLHAQGVLSDGDAEVTAAGSAAVDAYGELGLSAANVQAAIGAAHVTMIGLGPVGRLVARHLAAAGIGQITLSDAGDVSAADDFALAAGTNHGRTRMEMASEECSAVATDAVAIHEAGPEDGQAFASDLVVVEVDEQLERAGAANRDVTASGVPALFYAVGPLRAVVGPFVRPGLPGCHRCLMERERSHIRHYEEQAAFDRWLGDEGNARLGQALLGGSACLAAGLVTTEALRYLGGIQDPVTQQGALVADFRTSIVHREQVLPVPGCEVCGGESRSSGHETARHA